MHSGWCLMPQYFKHNKFSTMVRHLNTYGFKKINPWSRGVRFSHSAHGNSCLSLGDQEIQQFEMIKKDSSMEKGVFAVWSSWDLEIKFGSYHCELSLKKFTLSGLLNFIDGLWSSCVDERIIIFTTNNKDKLDPVLLRPGRMDMHISMSYLTIDGFKLLLSMILVLSMSYLTIDGKSPRKDGMESVHKDKDFNDVLDLNVRVDEYENEDKTNATDDQKNHLLDFIKMIKNQFVFNRDSTDVGKD